MNLNCLKVVFVKRNVKLVIANRLWVEFLRIYVHPELRWCAINWIPASTTTIWIRIFIYATLFRPRSANISCEQKIDLLLRYIFLSIFLQLLTTTIFLIKKKKKKTARELTIHRKQISNAVMENGRGSRNKFSSRNVRFNRSHLWGESINRSFLSL